MIKTMDMDNCYCVQFVGSSESTKRMVASLYLVNGDKQQQTLKVCVCDDLPHVVFAVGRLHKPAPGHDELDAGLNLQISYNRGLTITVSLAAEEDQELCVISPPKVIIPASAIWEPNAAFATDFQLQLTRMNVEAKLNVTITAQDDEGSDIPLNVSSRVHVKWQPNYGAGVRDMRRKWESKELLSASKSLQRPRNKSDVSETKSNSLNGYPAYQDIDRLVGRRLSSDQSTSNSSSDVSKAVRENWISSLSTNKSSDLPNWAKNGLSSIEDDFNYDDVVVV